MVFEYHTHPLLLFRESGSSLALDFEVGGDIFATLSKAMPPFVVFVLFVVNTNRRPMPPS